MNSILDSIKQLLGIPATDTAFDTDIIIHINSAFMALNQLGIGGATVFSISDNTTTWADYLSTDEDTYSAVKTYVFLLVREAFDPPSTASLMTSMQNLRRELEWRLSVQVPTPLESV